MQMGSSLVMEINYAAEILKRFRMLDYKTIATPMASNLNLLSDDSSEKVDATMYF